MNILNILKIIRIHIVVGGFLAFSLGALLSIAGGGSFEPTRFVLGYVVVFLADLSTHFGNDYFDVAIDKHNEQKKFFSGSRILVNHPNLRQLSKSISLSLLLFSNVLAILLIIFLNFPTTFFIIILGASLVGWYYSAPPIRLVSKGLGEVAVALVTGFAIPGMGYLVIRGQFDPLFVYFSIPFTIYGFLLSLSLHAPDVEVDRSGGKTNLTVRIGQRRIFFLIFVMDFLATISFWIYSWQNTFLIDLGVVFLFSIIPLMTGFLGFVGVFQKKKVNIFSAFNIAALFVFNMLMIIYLLLIVLAE
jgi:1,4-dihydroxy-2-naphthoate octaprenyltransferase